VSPSAAARIDRLRDQIRHHDRKYFVEAAPEISDRDYDRLVAELRELEGAHPELVTPDSPTQRVGEEPVAALASVRHRVPMMSIDNTYGVEELRAWGRRVEKLLAEGGDSRPPRYVLELKIDGVAVSLTYEQGLLTLAATRGNGVVGDDITHNVRTIRGVPLVLDLADPPAVVEVRGEVYMANSALVSLNERQAAAGLAPFANTRNVTAGSIRLLDPRECGRRPLEFFCHGAGNAADLGLDSLTTLFAWARQAGLPVAPRTAAFDSLEGLIERGTELIEELHDLDSPSSGCWGRRPRAPAGRSPGSSRSSRPRPGWPTSGCRWDAAARSRRWPISSRSSWRARSSAGPASTMPTRWPRRTSGSATCSWSRRPAR